jgi:hypothetical protein
MSNVLALSPTGSGPSENQTASPRYLRARLLHLDNEGFFVVEADTVGIMRCEYLEGSVDQPQPGDRLLVLLHSSSDLAVVLGRVGRYMQPETPAHMTLTATETLTLKCGEASVNLRADGQVMVKGEDVLLRAKGTQRIRAGNVAIN